MAARARKEKGFYAAFNGVSSVDILPKIEKESGKQRGDYGKWNVSLLRGKRHGNLNSCIVTESDYHSMGSKSK